MSELSHFHTITEQLDKEFKLTNRKDPITHERFEHGDTVVFCAGCGSAFLPESWAFMGHKHCGQVETLAHLPAIKELRLEARALKVEVKKEVKRTPRRQDNLHVALTFGGVALSALLLSLFLSAGSASVATPEVDQISTSNQTPVETNYANLQVEKYHRLMKQREHWRAEEFVQELLASQPQHPVFLSLLEHYAETKEDYLAKIKLQLDNKQARQALARIKNAEKSFKDEQMGLPALRHEAYRQLAKKPKSSLRKSGSSIPEGFSLREIDGFSLDENSQTVLLLKNERVYAKMSIPEKEKLLDAGFIAQKEERFVYAFLQSEKRFWRYTLHKNGQGIADFYEWDIPMNGGIVTSQGNSIFLLYHPDGLLELRDFYSDNLYGLFQLPDGAMPKSFHLNFAEKTLQVFDGQRVHTWGVR